jgi:hypothetical protein
LLRLRIRAGIAIAAAVIVLAAVGATVYLLQGSTDRLESDSGKGEVLADYGSINALPGQSADFSAVVINPGNAQAVFVSAALIPLRGYPVPRLVHLGVVHATPIIGSTLVSDDGWPPNGIKVRPFIGAGLAHGEIAVAFGVSGDTLGRDYAVAGLRIRYRVQGHVYDLQAWSAALDCVSPGDNGGPGHLTSQEFNACQNAEVNVDGRTAKMADLTSPDCLAPQPPEYCLSSFRRVVPRKLEADRELAVTPGAAATVAIAPARSTVAGLYPKRALPRRGLVWD